MASTNSKPAVSVEGPRKRYRQRVDGGHVRVQKNVLIEKTSADQLAEVSMLTGLPESLLIELAIGHIHDRWKEVMSESGGAREVATMNLTQRLRRTIDSSVKYVGAPAPEPDQGS